MSAKKKNVHFIGIGGIGMSAIAQGFVREGHAVSGSDIELSKMTGILSAMGIKIYEGHDARNVEGKDIVVYSSSIREENPELKEASRLGVDIWHRSRALAHLSASRELIAISGTHGKTSTTSMAGRIYEMAGLKPTVMVGGKVPEWKGNALLGDGSVMVAEADESDASFLRYKPQSIIVTNIDEDHMDYFKDLADIADHFERWIGRLKPGGKWFACNECAETRKLMAKKPQGLVRYGLNRDSAYFASDIQYLGPKGSEFTLNGPKGAIGRVALSLVGAHQVLNATGASALALENGLPFEAIQKALANFSGPQRRFEVKVREADHEIVDDYAHHPNEIRRCIEAARLFSKKKIVAVFQPHRYTRLQSLLKDFGASLAEADAVIVTDVYSAGEKPIDGVNAPALCEAIRNANGSVKTEYVRRAELLDALTRRNKSNECLVLMGAGDIGKVSDALQTADEVQTR